MIDLTEKHDKKTVKVNSGTSMAYVQFNRLSFYSTYLQLNSTSVYSEMD